MAGRLERGYCHVRASWENSTIRVTQDKDGGRGVEWCGRVQRGATLRSVELGRLIYSTPPPMQLSTKRRAIHSAYRSEWSSNKLFLRHV